MLGHLLQHGLGLRPADGHLADAEVALMKRDELSKIAEMFAEHIVQCLENIKA